MSKPQRRNLLVLQPLLKQGRPQRKSAKAARQALKQATRELVAQARRVVE
jgi:hypothetical protein